MLDPVVVRARQRVGQVLREKWRLDVLLGVGGMAAVYAATHRNGSRVAIKLLHPELSLNHQIRTRFLREGYVANSVGHDGAVRVMDDDTADDGSLFLVTELLDGETLEDRRVRFGGKLSEDEVLSLTDQILDVLIAAHAHGVVHRDLKPENVFLTRSGVIKVLDFGIARLREMSSASTATRSGASMGTPSYMPPEQARGRWDEVDSRTDLWAVGATMFTLLSGKLVHDGHTSNEVLLSAMTKPAPPVAEVVERVSPAVARLVDKSLAFEREKRWLDAGRMQEALRRAYVDRNGAQISTAPKLTVPETVPNRTLADAEGASSARLPTTGRPVEAGRGTEGAAIQWTLRTRVIVATASGALGLALLGGLSIVLFGGGGPSSIPGNASPDAATSSLHAPSGNAATMATPTTSSNPEVLSPPAAPVIAATDLPPLVATPPVRQAPAATRPLAGMARPTATKGGTDDCYCLGAPDCLRQCISCREACNGDPTCQVSCACKPTYRTDSDGNKHFKPECFR